MDMSIPAIECHRVTVTQRYLIVPRERTSHGSHMDNTFSSAYCRFYKSRTQCQKRRNKAKVNASRSIGVTPSATRPTLISIPTTSTATST